MNRNNLPKPLLKWAGGKRQLLEKIIENTPKDYNTYYEPFLGGAAVLFGLKPQKCIVNDLNEDLINVYKVIKDNPSSLIEVLKEHKEKHCKDYYYRVRELDRIDTYNDLSDVEKAARVIYLNRTCYNGLYRVNRNGFFNTPIGRYKNPNILDVENIMEISDYFNRVDISFMCGDYADSLRGINQGDFAYIDPPYDPVSKTCDFTSYTKDGFSKENQIELKEMIDKLNSMGVYIMLSNSDTDFINELYTDYNVIKVEVSRNINSKGDSRTGIQEVIITNY